MADTPNTEIVTEEVVEELQRAPNPQDNPRNTVMADIAARVTKDHEAEIAENATISTIDDDGNISQPAAPPSEEQVSEEASADAVSSSPEETPPAQDQPPASSPSKEAVEPGKKYKVTVEGNEIEVDGQAIIDAGIRTYQKETAADFRLRTASQLLEEAERRLAATQPGAAPASQPAPAVEGKTEAELANMLQFGTPEQSAEAVKLLRGSGASPEQIAGLAADAARAAARDEMQFERAKGYLRAEYGDVMQREPLRRVFFAEEARLRGEGDKRPYVELYKAIGESIRKDFSIPKPARSEPGSNQPAAGSAAARREAKAAAPAVPRTAAARLQESGPGKVPSPSEIIAGLAAKRGQGRLTPAPK